MKGITNIAPREKKRIRNMTVDLDTEEHDEGNNKYSSSREETNRGYDS